MDLSDSESAVEILLQRWRAGDETASSELVTLLYRDLRVIAEHRLRHSPGHSLVPTELVHEAYVKLVRSPGRSWENRCHFINAAGVAMRSILVDRARAKRAQKRSGSPTPANGDGLSFTASSEAVLHINEAISALERIDQRAAQVVALRFFAGLTEPEIAEVLAVNERTVRRDWTFARAWLRRQLDEDPSGDAGGAP